MKRAKAYNESQENYDSVVGKTTLHGGAEFTTKDSGERQQFASGMQRDVTEGKIKWHLIFSGPMLERWAKLMTRGAEKYDDNNWMKANSEVELTRFRSSAVRHFMQWYNGDTDEDHAAAVIFNINGAEYVDEGLAQAHAAADWSYQAQLEQWDKRVAAEREYIAQREVSEGIDNA